MQNLNFGKTIQRTGQGKFWVKPNDKSVQRVDHRAQQKLEEAHARTLDGSIFRFWWLEQ